MNTLKVLYSMLNTTLRITPDNLHCNCQRYVKRIGGEGSAKTIRGATSNLIPYYTSDKLTWKRFLTYLRILSATHLTVTLTTHDTILTAQSVIHYPTTGSRLNTDSRKDGYLLAALAAAANVTDEELERKIRSAIRRMDTNGSISSKITNMQTALTRPSLSWRMFVSKLYVLGMSNIIMTVTVKLYAQTVTVSAKLMELK